MSCTCKGDWANKVLRERPLYLVSTLSDQSFGLAGQITQVADGRWWKKAAAQQSVFQRLGNPLGVAFVRLAPRPCLIRTAFARSTWKDPYGCGFGFVEELPIQVTEILRSLSTDFCTACVGPQPDTIDCVLRVKGSPCPDARSTTVPAPTATGRPCRSVPPFWR